MTTPGGAALRAKLKNRVYVGIVHLGSLFLWLIDARRDVLGAEHVPLEGGAVLAISHFSYLDFVLSEWAIWGRRRRYVRFMATRSAFEHPFAGPLMRSMGHIAVDRAAGGAAYDDAVAAIRRGEIVGVFPESRVSRSFELLPFKAGSAKMAAATGAPIVPCVIWGSHRVMTRTRTTRLSKSRHTPVLIRFGEPIHVGGHEDPDLVTARLHQVMDRMLRQAQEDYPERPSPGAWWEPARRGGGAPTPEQAAVMDDQRR